MIQRYRLFLSAPYLTLWYGIVLFLLMPAFAHAQSYAYKVVTNGPAWTGGPSLRLQAIDAQDNLYGSFGNSVYELPAGTATLRLLAGNIASIDTISSLTVDGSGNIYGTGNTTRESGGATLWIPGSDTENGTLFEIAAGSSTATTLSSFDLNILDGFWPAASIAFDSAGDLFGTTDFGGTTGPLDNQGYGTIFEISAGTKTLVNRFNFNLTNGSEPGPLLRDTVGNFHGYTPFGGQNSLSLDAGGTVFTYSPGTSGLINQASFTGANGGFPTGAIALDQQGDLFGTAFFGGDLTLIGGGGGVVYEVPAGTNTIVDLATFHGWNGQNPALGVVRDAAGNLWGIASGGPKEYGVVYTVNPATQVLTVVYAFNVASAGWPNSGLFIDSHGDFFGTLQNGTVFELSPQAGAPVINSFTPTSGLPGASVVLTGVNFTGATEVTFGGTTASFQVSSSTSITATVPVYARSSAITVSTPSGIATSPGPFTVLLPAPTITGFSPAQGEAETAVTLFGTHFTGAKTVSFNGIPAPFAVTSDSTIGTSVPPGATTGKISVTTPVGTAVSTTSFTVQASLPMVTSFSPASGPLGARVTILGGNFRAVSAVRFNGVRAAFTVNSATSIAATVPQGATTGPISVTTEDGTAVSQPSFTVLPAPTITSFSPASGEAGVKVTVKGTHFTGVSAVKFDGVAAKAFSAASATQLTATVPTNATTGKITITTPGGTATSKTSFTVIVPAPTIIRFSPVSGRVGQTVDIAGTNLSGATRVTFDGVAAATFKVTSATAIAATVPKGAKTGKIGVTTRGGTATSKTNFTVTK